MYGIFCSASETIESKFKNPNKYSKREHNKDVKKKEKATKRVEKKFKEIEKYVESGKDPTFSAWYEFCRLFNKNINIGEYPDKKRFKLMYDYCDNSSSTDVDHKLCAVIRYIFGFGENDNSKDDEMWKILQKWGLVSGGESNNDDVDEEHINEILKGLKL